MNSRLWSVFAGICGLSMLSLVSIQSVAQTPEVKEKPAMYSYVANWQIPRAQWGAMEKDNDSNKAILDKAVADGTLVGYGNDENLVFGFRLGRIGLASTGIYSLDRSLFKFVAPGATERTLVRLHTGVTLGPDGRHSVVN